MSLFNSKYVKVVSLLVSILFLFNNISTAAPIFRDTLRVPAAERTVSADIEQSLRNISQAETNRFLRKYFISVWEVANWADAESTADFRAQLERLPSGIKRTDINMPESLDDLIKMAKGFVRQDSFLEQMRIMLPEKFKWDIPSPDSASRASSAGDSIQVKVLFSDRPDDPKMFDTIKARLSEAFGDRVVIIDSQSGDRDKTEWLTEQIKTESPHIVIVRSATKSFKDPKSTIFELPEMDDLQGIIRAGSGTTNVDKKKTAEAGISVARTHGSANSVADLTLYLMALLESIIGSVGAARLRSVTDSETKGIIQTYSEEYLRLLGTSKKWGKTTEAEKKTIIANYKQIMFTGSAAQEIILLGRVLNNRTVGLLGQGPCALETARKLALVRKFTKASFEVIAYSRNLTSDSALVKEWDVIPVSRPELIRRSHILSLHVPGLPELALTAEELEEAMNLLAIVNTSRSDLVPSELIQGPIKDKGIAYFGDLDITGDLTGQIIENSENILILPHVGANTKDAIAGVVKNTIDGLMWMCATLLGKNPLPGAVELEIVNGTTPKPIRASSAGQEVKVDERMLEIMSLRMQRHIVEQIHKAGSGHPGGSISIADLLSVLYFGGLLRYDPNDSSHIKLRWENRDRLVLSKGHAAPALYAALAESGFFPKHVLQELRELGSLLQGHPEADTPGVEIPTGSLGVGFSSAVGMALAGKMDDRDYTTYAILGDGELQEGQVTEAADFAAKNSLNNLIAFVDCNGYQIDGEISEVSVTDQKAKWEAMGWNVLETDGHNIPSIIEKVKEKKALVTRPTVIFLTTTKGKFLPGHEAHGAAPSDDDYKASLENIDSRLQELNADDAEIRGFLRDIRLSNAEKARIDAENDVRVAQRQKELGDKVNTVELVPVTYSKPTATRKAGGAELLSLGVEDLSVVAGSADLGGSTQMKPFWTAVGIYGHTKEANRYIRFPIAEANMFSVAAGLAACGKIPVISTFSVFTRRMIDQIHAILKADIPVIIVGTHVGLAVGPDGYSHQDPNSAAQIAVMEGTYIYEAADAEEARVLYRLAYDNAKAKGGVHYVRLARPDTPVLDKPEGWQEGAKRGFYTIYEGGEPHHEIIDNVKEDIFDITIASTGVATVDAVKAAQELVKLGMSVRVVNMTQLKAIVKDTKNMKELAGLIGSTHRIITVADANKEILEEKLSKVMIRGGIGGRRIWMYNLGISQPGESGPPAELYEKHGFDKNGILLQALRSFLAFNVGDENYQEKEAIKVAYEKLRELMRETYMDRLSEKISIDAVELRETIDEFKNAMELASLEKTSSLSMLPSFLSGPTGEEEGVFLGVDLGGEHLRIYAVQLSGNGQFNVLGKTEYKLTPDEMRGTAKQFFGTIAGYISKFCSDNESTVPRNEGGYSYNLGFTFSFPMNQTGVKDGTLIKWTKGYNVDGVVGENVTMLLQDALEVNAMGNVKVRALLNDTTATQLTGAYVDSTCRTGIILGTGTNVCATLDSCLIYNLESGGFKMLRTTNYDRELDKASDNPGEQILEKMVSGKYLGEVARLIIHDLIGRGLLLQSEVDTGDIPSIEKLDTPYAFGTEYVSRILKDSSSNLASVKALLKRLGVKNPSFADCKAVHEVCRAVSFRAAAITAVALSATLEYANPSAPLQYPAIAVDGSLYKLHPTFAKDLQLNFEAIFGHSAEAIEMLPVEDASGVGAAIAAAIATSRASSAGGAQDFEAEVQSAANLFRGLGMPFDFQRLHVDRERQRFSLDLSQTEISDLRAIGDLGHLENLNLASVLINNITALSRLKNLRILNLSNMPIDDINALKQLANLKELNISNTRIAWVSVVGLFRAHPNPATLKVIYGTDARVITYDDVRKQLARQATTTSRASSAGMTTALDPSLVCKYLLMYWAIVHWDSEDVRSVIRHRMAELLSETPILVDVVKVLAPDPNSPGSIENKIKEFEPHQMKEFLAWARKNLPENLQWPEPLERERPWTANNTWTAGLNADIRLRDRLQGLFKKLASIGINRGMLKDIVQAREEGIDFEVAALANGAAMLMGYTVMSSIESTLALMTRAARETEDFIPGTNMGFVGSDNTDRYSYLGAIATGENTRAAVIAASALLLYNDMVRQGINTQRGLESWKHKDPFSTQLESVTQGQIAEYSGSLKTAIETSDDIVIKAIAHGALALTKTLKDEKRQYVEVLRRIADGYYLENSSIPQQDRRLAAEISYAVLLVASPEEQRRALIDEIENKYLSRADTTATGNSIVRFGLMLVGYKRRKNLEAIRKATPLSEAPLMEASMALIADIYYTLQLERQIGYVLNALSTMEINPAGRASSAGQLEKIIEDIDAQYETSFVVSLERLKNFLRDTWVKPLTGHITERGIAFTIEHPVNGGYIFRTYDSSSGIEAMIPNLLEELRSRYPEAKKFLVANVNLHDNARHFWIIVPSYKEQVKAAISKLKSLSSNRQISTTNRFQLLTALYPIRMALPAGHFSESRTNISLLASPTDLSEPDRKTIERGIQALARLVNLDSKTAEGLIEEFLEGVLDRKVTGIKPFRASSAGDVASNIAILLDSTKNKADRYAAMEALVASGGKSAVQPLTDVFKNGKDLTLDALARELTVQALGQIGATDGYVFPALEQALNDEEQAVRLAAIRAISEFEGQFRTDLLRIALDNKNHVIREYALLALIREPALDVDNFMINELIRLTEDQNELVRSYAALALSRVAAALPAGEAMPDELRSRIVMALIERLLKRKESYDFARKNAAIALGDIVINPSGAGVDALRIAEAEDKVEFVKTEAEKALQKIEERIAARASSAGTPTGEELIREQLDYNPTYPNAPKEITVDIGKQAVGIFSDALETSTYLQNQLRDYQGDTSNFYLINKTRLSPEDFLTQYGIDINMFRGRVIDAADRSSDDIAAALLGPLQEKKITRMKVIANNAADILALSTLSRNSQIELLMLNLSDKSFEIISNSTELHKKYMDVHAKTLKAA